MPDPSASRINKVKAVLDFLSPDSAGFWVHLPTTFQILDCCDGLCSFQKVMISDIGWNYWEISKLQNYNPWVDKSQLAF